VLVESNTATKGTEYGIIKRMKDRDEIDVKGEVARRKATRNVTIERAVYTILIQFVSLYLLYPTTSFRYTFFRTFFATCSFQYKLE
jgi:hypothetical protein